MAAQRHGPSRRPKKRSGERVERKGDPSQTAPPTALHGAAFGLRASEAKYRALFEQAADAVVVFDPKTLAILDFNDEACQRLGYTREEFATLKISDFEAIESAEQTIRHSQNVMVNGTEIFETKHRTKNGTLLDIEIRAKAIRLGGAVLIQGVWRDTTERKRAERELQAANETLEQRVAERTEAIQILHDVTSVANQAQNPKQAIEYCVQRLTKYNGWSFGHALLPAADDLSALVLVYAHYQEDPDRLCRFSEATSGTRFRRGQGLPGRVFANGKPEWTTHLRRDLCGDRAAIAEELGMRTAVAFPVLVGEKVAAVLEFFSGQVVQPEQRIMDVMAGVGMQLGRIIERAEFEEHLLTIAEEVRQGIAQDLHDDVGQELIGLGLKTETLAEMLASAESPMARLAADIAAAVERTRGKARGLSRGLLSPELEEGALAAALERLAATTTMDSRIACTFAGFPPDPVLDCRVAMHLYRIAQEAVSNAVRHSRARNIRIALVQQCGETALRIEDDGMGLLGEPAKAGGMGLRTMRYRAGLVGGILEVHPAASGGTLVVCRLAAPPHTRSGLDR